jgi:hypothetical protein
MDWLQHHGILKQKWGVRNGPPYPLKGGAYTPAEKKAVYEERKKKKNSIYNKKHFDEVLKKGSKLTTLSYDKDRTKDTDMFYAATNKADVHQYNALFNKKIPKPIFDEKGNEIGTGQFLKYKIVNEAKKDLDVASEDSSADVFKELYSKDRDFYNYVTDPTRMRANFVDDKYKFKGYREAKKVLEKVDNGETPSEEDVKTMYRMFNYTIPAQGKDIQTQRAKFFKAMSNKGYEAVLDTNDALYGAFKARLPVIVFDQKAIGLKSISNTTTGSVKVSKLAFLGRKVLGI